jgi:hypothetical protein
MGREGASPRASQPAAVLRFSTWAVHVRSATNRFEPHRSGPAARDVDGSHHA